MPDLDLRIHVIGPPARHAYCLQIGKAAKAENGAIVETSGDDVTFELRVTAARAKSGAMTNITGPYAQGKPSERFFYLRVGAFNERREIQWVGRIKVPVAAIPWTLAQEAIDADRALVASFDGSRGDRPVLASVALRQAWSLDAG